MQCDVVRQAANKKSDTGPDGDGGSGVLISHISSVRSMQQQFAVYHGMRACVHVACCL